MEQEAESPHSPLSPSRALSGKRTLECGSAGEGTARKHARTTGASLFSSAAAASAALSTCTAGLTPIRTSCSIDSSVSAALSFGGTLAAQAAEDVVAMLAGTSNESAAAAAAALPTAAGCSSMEPQQEELEEEPCTPRASSFSTSIFSPPHSNAQRTYSNAAGGAAATPSTATPRHLASVTADAAGTSPNIAGTTACLDLPHLSPHLAPHHAPHQPFTRRVLSFNVWTGDAPEAAVIHPMNAPGAGVAGMPQVQAQAPGASNGGCWWLPSPATTPTAGSARGEAAPNPTFRAASPMRPAPSHGYSPRLTGLGLSAYSPAAPSNATGVPDRMVTGRVALLRAPQLQQGRDSHSQMLQEAAAEVHAGRPRAFLAAAHQLLELARRTQHSGGAVAGGAQAQGPGEVPLGAALPWALPGRGLSIRTHPQQAISSTSVMSAHAAQAPPDATQRPTAAVSAAAAATATHVHLGLPLLSISAVGGTVSGLGSAADALRSAAARQSPTGTLAITPGVWRLAGAKPAPANSGAPTTVSAVIAAASPPAAPSPAMRPGVEGLDDVEEVESPARRFPVAEHWEEAEAEPADSTPRAAPRAAALAAAAAPHSTPRAPASGTPARRSFFSPTASSCGAVGGVADATPSWGMASPAGVSVAGGATTTEPARSAAASGGGSGGVPGSATPVSQLQRPSRFASVRINRTAQLRFVLASTLAGMADSDTHPPSAQHGNDPDATGRPGQEHAAATQATSQATSHVASLASLVAPAAVERSTDAGLSPAAAAALDVDAARKAYPQLVARAFQDWLSLQPANSSPDDSTSNKDAQPGN